MLKNLLMDEYLKTYLVLNIGHRSSRSQSPTLNSYINDPKRLAAIESSLNYYRRYELPLATIVREPVLKPCLPCPTTVG
jgi:hypothetical protein